MLVCLYVYLHVTYDSDNSVFIAQLYLACYAIN